MKYKVTYYEWGIKKTISFDNKQEAMLEAYQLVRNSDVYINGKQVYTNYKY